MIKIWTDTKANTKSVLSKTIKGVICWELIPENTTVIAIRYRAQLNKLESEVVKQRLSNGKIYFQHDTFCKNRQRKIAL